MKLIALLLFILGLIGCSTARVLVKDCKGAGPGLENCEKVKEL